MESGKVVELDNKQELRGLDSDEPSQGPENLEVVSLKSLQENVKMFNKDTVIRVPQYELKSHVVSVSPGVLFSDTRLTRAKAKLLATHCSTQVFNE